MEKPYLSSTQKTRSMISGFGGINHNLVIDENEFYDQKNMTADFFPVLSPRKKRGIIRTFSDPHILYTKDKLAWVDGKKFYYNGAYVGEVEASDKQMCKIGALLVIFPDKKVYNTETGTFEDLEATFETVADVSYTLCSVDGTAYEDYTIGITAPDTPSPGQLWLDTSQSPSVLKQYSETYTAWTAIPSTYVKIASENIGKLFSQYDGVRISGSTDEQFNTNMVIQGRGDGYIIVIGIINSPFNQPTSSGHLTIKRIVPDMDFVTEQENRIWGCSSKNHEIYCCKLGDPKNWNCFMGLSSDSYAATIGSDGDFTGAISHLGYVLFLKEDIIHKVYGTRPANFQISDVYARGVQKGSERSLVIVNETLFYLSRNGVCAYDGSLPVTISQKLGSYFWTDAVGGTVGNKYYISMSNGDKWSLYAFDTDMNVWTKEDDSRVKWFSRVGNELYFVDDKNRLCAINGTTALYNAETETAKRESDFLWSVETGDIGTDNPDNKYIGNVRIRMTIPAGATVTVESMIDSTDEWRIEKRFTQQKKRSENIDILPRRCDHFRIRISGIGDVKIYSICKTIFGGSNLNGYSKH